MRIAVVSDIHGNLPALEAVVCDFTRRGVDAVVNLGDNVSGPLLPLETAQFLMEHVAALAVDVEPTVWNGSAEDFAASLADWRAAVGFEEGDAHVDLQSQSVCEQGSPKRAQMPQLGLQQTKPVLQVAIPQETLNGY